MSAELILGKISSIQYGKGSADVSIPERSDMVVPEVPFLSAFYGMPKIGDMVACIFNDDGGRLGHGVILGKIFSEVNPPGESGADMFFAKLPDGTIIKSSGSSMEITAATLKVKELTADKVITTAGVDLDQHHHAGDPADKVPEV